MEQKLQTKIIHYLKLRGVYVIKTTPGAGTPVGCPDIIGLYREKHLEMEIKGDEKSPDQPLQLLTQQRLREYNKWVYRVHPKNWPIIKAELEKEFF